MTQASDVIDRIDSLMHRKRVFVASTAVADAAAPAPTSEDEDIPVLTEIVDITEVSGDTPSASATPPLAPLLDAVAQDFAQQLQARFASELAILIDTTTARLRVEIQQTVHRITDETLRDLIAQRRQIALPLGDANEKNAD